MMDKELPKGWISTEAGNLFHQLRGVSYKKNDAHPTKTEGDILIVRGGNVQDGKIVSSDNDLYVNKKLVKPQQLVKKGDVIIVASTGSKNLIGKAAHSLKDEDEVSFGAFLTLLRPNQQINSKYFDYFYQSQFYRDSIRELSGGININNIRKEHLELMKFPLAPLPEQKRIVAKLDALFGHLDVLRDRLDRIPELLKNFRQQVLTQAVTGKLTEEWRGAKDGSKTGTDFIQEVILQRKEAGEKVSYKNEKAPYKVPESWSTAPIKTFGELTRGKSKHRPRNDKSLFGGPYPFIQTGDVARSHGLIDHYTSTYSELGLKQSRLFPKGTLCITIAANIADTGILDFDACFPDSVVGYLPFKNLYSSKFAMFFLRTIQKDLEHFAPATAQKNINLKVLNDIMFPIPPKDELDEIVSRVDFLFSTADEIEAQYQSLKEKIEKLPQAILSKAFKGELVAQDENDEPAWVLQERIKGEKTGKVYKKEEELRMVAERKSKYN